MKNKDNYLCISGQKIPLTDEQIYKIKASVGGTRKLGDIEVEETFKIGPHEFIILEHNNGTTHALLKDALCVSEFGDENNDYRNSTVRDVLDKFCNRISDMVGADNIIPHLVDLTSLDGLDDYGDITDRISLLTVDRYRRYVKIIDRYKLDDWNWLATPWSTPTRGYCKSVVCVSPRGIINYGLYFNQTAVRPFCIFNSDIFVS